MLLALLFTGANPFDSEATEAIAVDIISPSEAPPAPEISASSANESPEPPQPKFDVAALNMPAPPMPSPPRPQPEAKPAEVTKQAQQETRRSDATASSPVKGQEFGKAPPPPSQGPPPQMKGAATDGGMGGNQGTEKQANVANMFSMPLALPDGRLGGAFDAPASETAKIERGSADAFRDRIKSCAMLPAGVSPSDRVSLVIRIALKPDGTLAGQPTLIEASASPKGPALLQSLFAGLAKCQPFNMLPADKYQEWRSLDIRFTPQDLGPG
jgi:hypothetical protein